LRDVFVLGAGFSANAGLPIQSGFTERLIYAGTEKDPTRVVVPFLRRFIAKSFGHLESAKPKYWPDLEDIFTCIDLSANTGHHLGFDFPPSELRKVRRALITRIIGMLRAEYEKATEQKPKGWGGLQSFFENIDLQRSAFINLNWDTVTEEFITDVHGRTRFDYGCGAIHASFRKVGMKVEEDRTHYATEACLIKMHGSANWLYCDCCRRLFWFPPRESLEIAEQILKAEEWQDQDIQADVFRIQWACTRCRDVTLGTCLATFTYLKALDFPMFQKSWFAAERLLRNARRWVFIGYSLPAADYAFKYLLKRVQLSRKSEPEILVVTKGRHSKLTYSSYQRFFGQTVKPGNFYDDGLSPRAVLRLCCNESN
jgi:hypothetical protein